MYNLNSSNGTLTLGAHSNVKLSLLYNFTLATRVPSRMRKYVFYIHTSEPDADADETSYGASSPPSSISEIYP